MRANLKINWVRKVPVEGEDKDVPTGRFVTNARIFDRRNSEVLRTVGAIAWDRIHLVAQLCCHVCIAQEGEPRFRCSVTPTVSFALLLFRSRHSILTCKVSGEQQRFLHIGQFESVREFAKDCSDSAHVG